MHSELLPKWPQNEIKSFTLWIHTEYLLWPGGIKLKTNKEIFIATSIWGNSARSFQKPHESGNKFKTYKILWNNDNKHKIMVW